MNKLLNCKVCEKKLIGRKELFCSRRCLNRYHQSYPAQKKRGLARKIKLFLLGGGQCSHCGYKKNLASLSFHHLDARKKDFRLDARSLSNRKLKVIMQEFKKCILLCHNCHHETHNPDLTLGSASLSRLL